MELKDVCVVLPAGGCGVRMEMKTPKQYCKVLNRPVILFTILSFHRISWIKNIVVVVSHDYVEYMERLVTKYRLTKVKLTLGSGTRHRSIFNGVKALEQVCKSDDVVLIHDAVRMFTDEKTLHDIAIETKKHKACGIYRGLVSTVIAPDSDGFLEESLDRNRYRASEMPQGFHYSVILSAYQKATDYDFDYGTECLLLASKYSGVKAKLLEGSSNLWKVTHKKDLYAAEGIVKESGLSVCIKCNNKDLKKLLCEKMAEKRMLVLCGREDSINENGTIPNTLIDVLDYNPDISKTLRKNLDDFLKEHEQIDSISEVLDKVVMFVLRVPNESVYIDILQIIQNLKKVIEQRETLIFCVVYQDDCKIKVVSDMVTSIVWNRDPVMSGQTLFA